MGLLARVTLGAALLPACVAGLGTATAQQQAPQEPPRIETLIEDGWEVAGYIAVTDNRSLILFKHKDRHYLVQCSVLIDAMRSPRVVVYCHELH
jgi:hypothetical protein